MATPASATGGSARVLPLLLLPAYPALVHAGVVLELPLLRAAALVVLYLVLFLQPLAQRRGFAWLGLAVFALAVGALMQLGGGMLALYVAPLALLALAFTAFARSLGAGATPLVTRIAEAARGPLPPELRRHTLQVTRLWAVTLALMFGLALLLSITGPRTLWSLVTNVLNYALMGLLFVGEYAYRRWRYPDHDREGFAAYLRILVASAPRMRGGA